MPVEQLVRLVLPAFLGHGRPRRPWPFADAAPGFFAYLQDEPGLRPELASSTESRLEGATRAAARSTRRVLPSCSHAFPWCDIRNTVRVYLITQWDVFTSEALSGNPLAILPDARGLTENEMQKLARETNLSETAFVVPRSEELEGERGVRVRIFTPEKELPFAGHPSLGVAMMLRDRGHPSPVVLDLAVGRIEVQFESNERFGEIHQVAPRFLSQHDTMDVALHLGLRATDIDATVPVQIVSTGLPYLIVPVRSLECVRRLRVEWSTAGAFLASLPEQPSLYVVTRETVDPRARLHARCLDPEREDPATGSAAGCAAAWMVTHGIAAPGEQVVIEQGLEVLRPSRLFVRAAFDGSRVTNVRVGGHAVEVMRGEYRLDGRHEDT